jgi:hypothetical protein
MPLSESEAGSLAALELPVAGGWPGDRAVVVRCSWCGYLVRTHHADACACGRLATRLANGVIHVYGAEAAAAEVYGLGSLPPAG